MTDTPQFLSDLERFRCAVAELRASADYWRGDQRLPHVMRQAGNRVTEVLDKLEEVRLTPPPNDQPAVRARIVEVFVEACDDTFPKYNLYHRRDAVNAANLFLDRYPHIIEGWPTDDRR